MNGPRRAVFLDRDGTLNEEKGYLYRLEDWVWTPGALEAIRGFNRLGLLVIVVSNQSGIARGYFTQEDVEHLHDQVKKWAAAAGAHIDGFYYCPHHPEYGEVRDCNCRKPRPGLLLQAQRDHDIDLARSFMIGDKAIDIKTGQTAGVTSILVRTGYGEMEQHKLSAREVTVANLYAAYTHIAARLRKA